MNNIIKSIGALLGLFVLHTNQASIVLSGNQSSGNLQTLINRAQNVDGVLYQGFGSATFPGTNVIPISPLNFNNRCFAIALQPDGKIVVGGTMFWDIAYERTIEDVAYFTVARFNEDGTLDASFGKTIGNTVCPLPGVVYIFGSLFNEPITNDDIEDVIGSLVIQPDGKIIAGGYSGRTSIEHTRVAFARFNTDGTLDDTFGHTGTGTASYIPGTFCINESICESPFFSSDYVTSIALETDGTILAGGTTEYRDGINRSFYALMVKVTPDGLLDSGFASTVTDPALTSYFPGTVFISQSITPDNIGDVNQGINAIALQADGRIVAGGYAISNDGMAYPYHMACMRFTSDGAFDSGFGKVGNYANSVIPGTMYITESICGDTDTQNNDCALGIALQKDGKIILGGCSGHGSSGLTDNPFIINLSLSHFAVARLMPDGSLDSNFGQTGAYTNSIIPGTVYITESINGIEPDAMVDFSKTLALQNDGQIILGGVSGVTGSDPVSPSLFALARFTTYGGLDPSFGAFGSGTQSLIPGTVAITKSISGNLILMDTLNALALRPNGAIVTAGYSHHADDTYPRNNWFAIAEFFNPQNIPSYNKAYIPVGAGVNC